MDLKVKPRINKRNGQINISIPKKKLSSNMKNKLLEMKTIKIKIKGLNG